jgi:methylmalonyl-CoA/ethylmalonyl-CoA epimerase
MGSTSLSLGPRSRVCRCQVVCGYRESVKGALADETCKARYRVCRRDVRWLFSRPAALETVVVAESSDVDFDIALDHVALSVPDIGESIAWYQKMFGFKEVRRGGQPNGMQTALVQRGDIRIELFQVPGAAPLPESRRNPSEDFRTHGLKHFAFRVKDIRAVLAQLQARGVKVALSSATTLPLRSRS